MLSSVDILLIALGCNDATNASSGVTPSAFATNLADIVGNLKTATTSAALIHPIPGTSGGTSFWGSSVGGFTSATFYQAADTLGLPMLDLSDRWQDYATANAGGLMFDVLHPNSTGYHRIGVDAATGLLLA